MAGGNSAYFISAPGRLVLVATAPRGGCESVCCVDRHAAREQEERPGRKRRESCALFAGRKVCRVRRDQGRQQQHLAKASRRRRAVYQSKRTRNSQQSHLVAGWTADR